MVYRRQIIARFEQMFGKVKMEGTGRWGIGLAVGYGKGRNSSRTDITNFLSSIALVCLLFFFLPFLLPLVGGALWGRLPTKELLLELVIMMVGKIVGKRMIESSRVIGRGTKHRTHASGTPVTV